MEHGPFGSPHRPQPPWEGIRPSVVPPADTAKTESCFSSAWLLHEGHSGWREPLTMVSKA